MTEPHKDIVRLVVRDERTRAQPGIARSVALELEDRHVEQPSWKRLPDPFLAVVCSKRKTPIEAGPRCPWRPGREKRVQRNLVRQRGDQPVAVRTRPGVWSELGSHPPMRHPPITARPEPAGLSGRVPEKVVRAQIRRGNRHSGEATGAKRLLQRGSKTSGLKGL